MSKIIISQKSKTPFDRRSIWLICGEDEEDCSDILSLQKFSFYDHIILESNDSDYVILNTMDNMDYTLLYNWEEETITAIGKVVTVKLSGEKNFANRYESIIQWEEIKNKIRFQHPDVEYSEDPMLITDKNTLINIRKLISEYFLTDLKITNSDIKNIDNCNERIQNLSSFSKTSKLGVSKLTPNCAQVEISDIDFSSLKRPIFNKTISEVRTRADIEELFAKYKDKGKILPQSLIVKLSYTIEDWKIRDYFLRQCDLFNQQMKDFIISIIYHKWP